MRKTEFDREKVDAMLKHHSYAKAAVAVRQNRGSFHRYIKRAERAGFLFKKGKVWHKGPDYISTGEKRMLNEVHNLRIKYPVLNPDAEWVSQSEKVFRHPFYEEGGGQVKPIGGMQMNLHTFTDIERFHVKTTTKSVILVMNEGYPLVAETPEELEKMIVNRGLEYREILVRRFAVRLGSCDGCEFEISSQHWVNRRFDDVAKRFVDAKVDLVIVIDGERRTLVDKSKRRWDLEQVNKKHAPPDAKAWDKLGTLLDTGKFDAEKILQKTQENGRKISEFEQKINALVDLFKMSASSQFETSQNMRVLSENWRSHVRFIQESTKIMQDLREVLRGEPR